MPTALDWLNAFLLTQAVEVPIYVLGLGASVPAAFAASALTHPVVWFGFFSPAFAAPYSLRLVAAELFAWLAEAAWFAGAVRLPRSRALGWALVANAASVLAGLATRALFDWP